MASKPKDDGALEPSGGAALNLKDEGALRALREVLRAQLVILDRLGEDQASIELNSCLEILNIRLGEPTTALDIEALQRQYLSD
jgi:uncharacterized protein (DUF934 family)